jgi:hypothetical protein
LTAIQRLKIRAKRAKKIISLGKATMLSDIYS